ncbi:alpha-glucosidase [Streptococcus parasanguinis]|uniref:alpha-glucosidase n=1 Tax=Streptococcus parasanguinis TaxID=1318 RepID=UPI0020C8B54D|nr:alpha-glucosidase [Streptococcus parasanguinis]MCP8989855.1 alpha-glucosidase [Streptococcus parasanguinis]MCP8992246.1 alpha-glucosidase [Streptococcus parasanguinis]MCP9002590.1 alpha-glucosidase [Streptococcus parasanguinis]MCP9008904.1 alpha-glucosidase [Streptococcus parasanguinis]MCP9033826.1 alpha-glucosidase [Streptococcus parasanguinis]
MEKDWWKGKVAYQIYPKSFKDSNGDGVGDLNGITEELDYLQDLGIDILWLSPIYKSPFIDQGYDISDYYAIDPLFGTMEDMEELIAEGKKRGISIIMDLVVNHCSSHHEWFQKALADPDGPYADYFYFIESDKEPNNWESYFGGSVWEPVPGANKYYLHSFHKDQPDLNWQNPVLREEIYKMINWWLDKGIAGFRIDAIINIKKDLEWRSLPSDRENGLVPVPESLVNAQSIEPFLQELKERTFAKYNAFTVGEVFNETDEELHFFIGKDGVFSSIFDFKQTMLGQEGKGWFDHSLPTADELKESIFQAHERADSIGVLSTIIENHDEPRGVSHYIAEGQVNDTSKKALGTIQILRKGIPFIYQGQEIGMENQVFESVEDFDDIATINGYHVAKEAGLSEEEALAAIAKYSRDNARTPMQWSAEPGLGFSDGSAWLISPKPDVAINVEDQEKDPNSILNYYRQLTALYRHPLYGNTIRFGDMIPAYRDRENIIAFERRGDKRLLVVSNFQNRQATLELPAPIKTVVLNNTAGLFQEGDQVLELTPYQTVVLELVE